MKHPAAKVYSEMEGRHSVLHAIRSCLGTILSMESDPSQWSSVEPTLQGLSLWQKTSATPLRQLAAHGRVASASWRVLPRSQPSHRPSPPPGGREPEWPGGWRQPAIRSGEGEDG